MDGSRKSKKHPIISWPRSFAVGGVILLLMWLPFPLGSAISWGAGLFEVITAGCMLLWCAANMRSTAVLLPDRVVLWVALLFFGSAISWAVLQSLPVLPVAWDHPIWLMTQDILAHPVNATVSLNPWRTQSEALKLTAYLTCTWLAYSMAREYRYASVLHNAVIFISASYVIYGYCLLLLGLTQPQLIYGIPFPVPYVAGPFMLHNSFATYCGIGAIAAIARLVSQGSDDVIGDRGLRRLVLSLLKYAFGRGAFLLAAAILLVSGVIASASRGGAAALTVGLLVMAGISFFQVRRSGARMAAACAGVLLVLPMLSFLLFNSAPLTARLNDLVDAGTADHVRLELWASAHRMIASAPWQGLGLGTFQDAYPLYAGRVLPFVMDKAHCDYLELVAGLGIPAAAALLLSLFLLSLVCLKGAFRRRRHRFFALTGFCTSALVAVHSGVDFGLQMPAVGALYAVLLGVGVAQSQGAGPG